MDPGGRLQGLYEQHKRILWTTLLAAPVVVLGLGLIFAPHVFYDQFIWRHIWGPTLVDARHSAPLCLEPDGAIVTASQQGGTWACPGEGVMAFSGYTIVSELTYGLVLAVLLYGIYTQVLRRFDVRTDGAFTAALIPYILLGPSARSLEDARIFLYPGTVHEANSFAWLHISPWIYFQIAFFALAGLLLGIFLERASKSGGNPRTVAGVFAGAVGLYWAGYSAVYVTQGHTFHAIAHPVWPFLAALAGILFVYWFALRGSLSKNHVLFAFGLPLVAWPLALHLRWLLGEPWTIGKGLHWEAGLLIVALALGVVVAVRGIAVLLNRRGVEAAVLFTTPFNLALLFGHMLDGFATYIAIEDPLGLVRGTYTEKHPVSDFFLNLFGDGLLAGLMFPVIKLLMVIVIVYLLDKDFLDTRRHPGTVALAAGPGTAPPPSEGEAPVAGAASVEPDAAEAAQAAAGTHAEEESLEATPPDGTGSESKEPEDAAQREADLNLVGLIKMAIFVLGFAPGLRDLLLVVQGF